MKDIKKQLKSDNHVKKVNNIQIIHLQTSLDYRTLPGRDGWAICPIPIPNRF